MKRIIGLDLGDKRIGIAVCDPLRLIASPHGVYLRSGDDGKDIQYFADLQKELDAEYFCNRHAFKHGWEPRFSERKSKGLCRKNAAKRHAHCVFDERLSTRSAKSHDEGNGAARRKKA